MELEIWSSIWHLLKILMFNYLIVIIGWGLFLQMGRVDAFPQSNNKKETIIPWTNVFEKHTPSSSEQGI